MRVFVSYSRRDGEFVERLVRRLEAEGHDVWVDTEDIRGSEQWRASIVAGIHTSDVILLVVSAASMASANVEREVTIASDQDRRIVPLVLHPAEPTGSVAFVIAGLQEISFADQSFDAAMHQLDAELAALGSPSPRALPPPLPSPAAAPKRWSLSWALVAVIGAAVVGLLVGWLATRGDSGTAAKATSTSTSAALTATVPSTSDATSHAGVNAKVWFAGFDIAVDGADFDAGKRQVKVATTFVNRQAETADPLGLLVDNITALEWQGRRTSGFCSCGQLAPGASNRTDLVFDVDATFQFPGTTLVFGGPQQHQAVVALDGRAATGAAPISRSVSGVIDDGAGTTFTLQRVDVVPATCHGLADRLGYSAGPAGQVAVVAWGSATTTKKSVGLGSASLVLPDGTGLASSSLNGYVYALAPGQPVHDVGVCFDGPAPVSGTYRLVVTAVGVDPPPPGLTLSL
jgi:hypothetical protein